MTQKQASLYSTLTRDIAVVLLALSAWAAADAWYVVTNLGLALGLSVANGIFAGYIIATRLHEWGHYLGALAGGADVTRKQTKGLGFFSFDFDYEGNDRKQFHWMTYGGHVLPWLGLILLVLLVPLDSLGRIALISSIFGFIVFATVIEYNIIKDTFAGADPLGRLQELSARDFRNAGSAGIVAAFLGMAVLS